MDEGVNEQRQGEPSDPAQPAQVQAPTDAAGAVARLSELQGNREWMAAYFAGDRAKAAEFTRLHELAFSKEATEAKANAEAFPDATGPSDYRLDFGAPESEEQAEALRGVEEEIRGALHAERVSPVAVSVARQIIERNGILSDEDLAESRRRGLEVLEQRHGKERAAELMAEAGRIWKGLAGRSETLAHLVERSGAGNDPHLIETIVRAHRRAKL